MIRLRDLSRKVISHSGEVVDVLLPHPACSQKRIRGENSRRSAVVTTSASLDDRRGAKLQANVRRRHTIENRKKSPKMQTAALLFIQLSMPRIRGTAEFACSRLSRIDDRRRKALAVAWKRSRRRGLSEMARARWISRCVSYGRSLSLPCTPFPCSFLPAILPRAYIAAFPIPRRLFVP